MIGLLVFLIAALIAVLFWGLCLRAVWNPFRAMRRRLLSVFLLEHIGAVVRLHLPLTRGIGACATRLSHASEADLNNIEADLDAGLLLGDALGRTHLLSRGPIASALDLPPSAGECLIRPSEAEVLRIAEMTGNLDAGVDIVLAERRRASDVRTWLLGTFAYVIAIVIVLGGVLTGIMTFIVPKFKAMFSELNVTLPRLTQLLLAGADVFARRGFFLPLLMLLIIPLFYWPSSWGRAMTRAQRGFGEFVQRIVYFIPFIHGPLRRAQLGEFCRELSMLIRVGVPAHRALETIAEGTMNPWFRSRVAEAARLCEQGMPMGEALDRARLNKRPGWFASADASEDSIAAGLNALAETYSQSVAWPMVVAVRVAPPLMIICLGAVVGCVVIGLFLPLLQLISNMAG